MAKNMDLALIFGGGHGGPARGMSRPSRRDDAARGDDAEESDEPEVPGDVAAAYDEYEANPSAKTFWEAVQACVQNSGDYGDDEGA